MRNRTPFAWLLWGCLTMLVLGLVWMSANILKSERQRIAETRENNIREQSRLALWRLDTNLLSAINLENSRSVEDYKKWARNYLERKPEDKSANDLSKYALSYFDINLGDRSISHSFSREGKSSLADYGKEGLNETLLGWGENLSQKGLIFGGNQIIIMQEGGKSSVADTANLSQVLPEIKKIVGDVISTAEEAFNENKKVVDSARLQMKEVNNSVTVINTENRSRVIMGNGGDAGINDYEERKKLMKMASSPSVLRGNVEFKINPFSDSDKREESVTPFEVKELPSGEWVLLRFAEEADVKKMQGMILDREALTRDVLKEIDNILPQAALVSANGNEEGIFSLAALPAVLSPGGLPNDDLKTVYLSLYLAWGMIGISIIGVIIYATGINRMNERRMIFASAVSHELRTPLTTFNMYAHMLNHGLVPPGKTPRYMDALEKESIRLKHLVNNVLAYTRVEKRSSAFVTEDVSVSLLIQEIIPRITARLAEGGMRFSVFTPEALDSRFVKMDPVAVEQILYNLADNATKYANEIGSSVNIALTGRKKYLEILFADSGSGIEEGMRRLLFRPFSRSSEAAAGKKPGIGLGLALSRELAYAMKGNLLLKSSSSAGSVFELRLLWGEEPRECSPHS